MRRLVVVSAAFLAVVGFLASTAAAAGRDGSPNSSSPVTLPARGTLHVSNTALGPVLVDVHGRTLYARDRDTSRHVSCAGRCAKRWPPLVVDGRPTPGCPCVDPRKLATVPGPNGRQVSYGGHPLYRSTLDRAPGQTRGQGRQGFSAVDQNGDLVAGASPPVTPSR